MSQPPTDKYRIKLPRELVVLAAIGGLLSLLSPNPLHTLAVVLLIPLLFLLLWRPGEVPALLFAAGYQWMQVSMPIINANFAGISLSDNLVIPNLQTASTLGLLCILVLAVGMRAGRGPVKPELIQKSRLEAKLLSGRRLLLAYVVSHLLFDLVSFASTAIPGLRQPLMVFFSIRWIVIFLIFWAAIHQPRFRPYALGIFSLEIAIGFLGFFAEWKQVFFIAILAIIGASRSPKTLLRPSTILVGVSVLLMGFYWQAIKVDYREFMNQGSRSQAVLVSTKEQVDYLTNSLLSLTLDDLKRGYESGVERVGYLEYFGHSITMVPEYIPFQNGRLWREAIIHPVTPRLLFPDKSVIDDSLRVNEFTGLRVAGAAQGTSISLGYAAESYIDFGPFLMFVPVFLLGAFWGLGFRMLTVASQSVLLSIAFATIWILAHASYYETSNIKLLGGGIAQFLGSWLILRYGGRVIWELLKSKNHNSDSRDEFTLQKKFLALEAGKWRDRHR